MLREVEAEEKGDPGDAESAARQAAGDAADALLEEELSDEEATARILEQLNAQDEAEYGNE